MSKAIIEALTMRVEALEKSDKNTSMRLDAVEKKLDAPVPPVNDVKDSKKKDKDKDKKDKKEKKEKKEKPDPDDKPKKKRTTGYILFCNDKRDDVKTKLSLTDEKPKNTEVMTELARLWRAIDQDEKDEWNAKAKPVECLDVVLADDDDDDDEDDN